LLQISSLKVLKISEKSCRADSAFEISEKLRSEWEKIHGQFFFFYLRRNDADFCIRARNSIFGFSVFVFKFEISFPRIDKSNGFDFFGLVLPLEPNDNLRRESGGRGRRREGIKGKGREGEKGQGGHTRPSK
jgi:hypothetical protein